MTRRLVDILWIDNEIVGAFLAGAYVGLCLLKLWGAL
jgi:hypothetical protein